MDFKFLKNLMIYAHPYSYRAEKNNFHKNWNFLLENKIKATQKLNFH